MTLSEALADEVHNLKRRYRNSVRRNIRLRHKLHATERERDRYRALAIAGAVRTYNRAR